MKTISRRLYDAIIQKVLIAFILSTLPAAWLTIVSIVGQKAPFSDSAGKLAPAYLASVIVAIVLCSAYALLKSLADNYNSTLLHHGNKMLMSIVQATNSAKAHKYTEVVSFIDAQTSPTFCASLSPKGQMLFLLESLRLPLAEIFGLDQEQIGLSVLYKARSNATWTLIATSNIETEMTASKLSADPGTTAYHVLKKGHTTIFYPNKRVANAEGQYVYGPKDVQCDNKGSVLCHDVSIRRKRKYMSAVLSITTYGKQICKDRDEEAERKLKSVIIPTISNRIRLELATQYISENMDCRGKAR
jgi:hypothetical protein